MVNIEHNEWVFRSVTWNDVLVVNTKSGSEVCVPRRYLGDVPSIDEPVILIGLTKELEYKEGVLLPHVRRVIEMPRAVNGSPRGFVRSLSGEAEVSRPAPVVAIRLESGPSSRARRFARGSIATGILACLTIAVLVRDGALGWHTGFTAIRQADLPLTAQDDYASIVSKLGSPETDRWRSGAVSYRRLWYPQRALALILTGRDQDHATYAGAIDRNGRILHTVELPDGRNSVVILRRLRTF